MATKTISIDLDAYARLKQVQRADESFSQVIKRVVRPAFDLDHWLQRLDQRPLSRKAAAAVARRLAARRRTSRRER